MKRDSEMSGCRDDWPPTVPKKRGDVQPGVLKPVGAESRFPKMGWPALPTGISRPKVGPCEPIYGAGRVEGGPNKLKGDGWPNRGSRPSGKAIQTKGQGFGKRGPPGRKGYGAPNQARKPQDKRTKGGSSVNVDSQQGKGNHESAEAGVQTDPMPDGKKGNWSELQGTECPLKEASNLPG